MKIRCDTKIAQTTIVWAFLILSIGSLIIEGTSQIREVAILVEVVPLKNRQQIEIEKAVKEMYE